MGNEDTSKKRARAPERDVQKLGWLTESAMQPKKHRFIEGVGARGLPEMQAQLYKLEQEAAGKKAAGQSLTKPRRVGGPLLGKANKGVEERDKLDRLQAPTDANRLAESEAALKRKAELYDRLARSGGDNASDDTYNVDFLGKSSEAADHGRPPPDADAMVAAANVPNSRLGIGARDHIGNLATGDSERERARQQWVEESEQSYAEMSAEEERRERRVNATFDLERETEEGRRRAASEKERRKKLEEAKRKKLKAALLKQMASKLKAAKAAEAGSG